MNPYDEIRLYAKHWPAGTQIGGLSCPFCNGGRHGDKALSIVTTHSGAILFICHRAQCGKTGRVDGTGGYSSTETEANTFKPRIFEEPTRWPHTVEEYEYFERFGIDNAQIEYHHITVGEDSGRIVFPVYGCDMVTVRGHEARAIDGSKPKTLHFKELDEPWLGWYFNNNNTTVIVEDVISAIRVSRSYNVVSLMGSNITKEDMIEIVANGGDDLVLCLDRDATQKALAFQQKYRYLAPGMRVVPLMRDLKYETDVRIRELIEGETV